MSDVGWIMDSEFKCKYVLILFQFEKLAGNIILLI